MSSVLGVSVGACSVRLARPYDNRPPSWRPTPESFDLQSIPISPDKQVEELVAETIGVTFETAPEIAATAIAYRGDQRAKALRTAMARQQLTNYELVPEVGAAMEFAACSDEFRGVSTLVVYDLGSTGLSISVADLVSRTILHTERTSDISGDYLDSLIREQQINAGRIAHPQDPGQLEQLDALCRAAKERLATHTAVALPSEHGLVLLSRENFEALIGLAIESSARRTAEAIRHAERPVQAVLAIGGGARIPLIGQILGHHLGLPVIVPEEPETVTARGAALLARPARPARPTVESTSPPYDERLTPSWLSRPSPKRQDRRAVSGAVLTVTALAAVAVIGLVLGYGSQVLEEDSHSSGADTSVPPTTPGPTTTTAGPQPVAVTPTAGEHAPLAEPPPPVREAEKPTPPPPPGPNTIVVPGLPPVVVPTIPLPPFPFPPPPPR
ncbi:Hsp70 family protein [Nocardia paucivorans]|uniref:Hsp70 family protein n=1 Tax=Nocardia paucivorans TaxID=114259 RepID=UPI00031CCBF0|nr:Hsp70 family protein [Nocardia paucivorans]